jgi:hypothetical protein
LDSWRSAQLTELQDMREAAHLGVIAAMDNQDWAGASSFMGRLLQAQEREARLLGLDSQPAGVVVPTLTEAEAREILAGLPPL